MKEEHLILPVFLPNRGCPSRCVFCDQSITAGSAPTRLTPSLLVSWVEEARRQNGREGKATAIRGCEIAYFGATFTGLPLGEQEAWLQAGQTLIQRGLAKSIRISTRPDHVDDSTIERLVRQGVSTVELGVQSLSTPVLTLSQRGYDAATAESAVLRLMKAGCDVVVQLMPFLPGSTQEDDLHAARRVALLRPQGLRLFPTLVLRGTRLAEWYERGEYKPAGYAQAAHRCAAMMEPALEAGVKVLRIGLQDSESLRSNLVAGPHHPALGELAWASLLATVLSGLLQSPEFAGSSPRITVGPRAASLMLGHAGFGRRHLSLLVGRTVDIDCWRSLSLTTGETPWPPMAERPHKGVVKRLGEWVIVGNSEWLHLDRADEDADSSLEESGETG